MKRILFFALFISHTLFAQNIAMFHAHNVNSGFSCGGTLTINHTSGTVAPETKTVSYGTVTSSLSGASKCWITQNLGADNQASSATDATDASAGWYWQFNRKQGYMVGPTPAWTAIGDLENSDWTSAEDPCTIELGTGWRIPTKTEWTNADANGGWTNYTDAYNSVLKLHAGGRLRPSDGLLVTRGTNGEFFASTQETIYAPDYYGQALFIGAGYSFTGENYRGFGYSIRCIKD